MVKHSSCFASPSISGRSYRAVHIGIAALLLVLDRRTSGRVHSANLLIVAGVAVIYAIANGSGLSVSVTDYATGLMPAGAAVPMPG